MTLDELLESLMRQHDEHTENAIAFDARASESHQQAAIIHARIQGIEEAREMLEIMVVTTPAINTVGADLIVGGNGSKKPRRPRRDIVALVREALAKPENQFATNKDLARQLGCREAQIVSAQTQMSMRDAMRRRDADE